MAQKPDAIIVFTAKCVETLLSEGGTSSWRLDRNHARQCSYAVCTRNANADWVEGTEEHQSAFLVGKVSDVVQSPRYADRYLIQFSEYALVNIPHAWKGDRNPVKYGVMKDLGIDPTTLKWRPMPTLSESSSRSDAHQHNGSGSLTIVEAKKRLAQTLGVAPDAIEITVRG